LLRRCSYLRILAVFHSRSRYLILWFEYCIPPHSHLFLLGALLVISFSVLQPDFSVCKADGPATLTFSKPDEFVSKHGRMDLGISEWL
jgi:hypothetical protein